MIALVASFVGIAQALVVERQASGCSCAGVAYTASDIFKAVAKAEAGGASGYPHKYHDYEGFSFPACSGTFYEYPLKSGSVYSSGSPGANRVIYDTDGDICACLTHTGASTTNGGDARNVSSRLPRASSCARVEMQR
ncbi:hypothetical protein H0H87_004501 [Tephrocybe sp. NHM501043]|nr:hypothetical protein H0H87_004501 [Tephrocybe sp. NHM501043]